MKFNEFVEKRETELLIERCARLFAEKGVDPDSFIDFFVEEQQAEAPAQNLKQRYDNFKNSSFMKGANNLLSRGVDFVGGLFADKYQKALKSLKNLQQFLDANEEASKLMSINDTSKSVKDWVGSMVKQLEAEKGLAGLAGGNQSSQNSGSKENAAAANNAPGASRNNVGVNAANAPGSGQQSTNTNTSVRLPGEQTAEKQSSDLGTSQISTNNNASVSLPGEGGGNQNAGAAPGTGQTSTNNNASVQLPAAGNNKKKKAPQQTAPMSNAQPAAPNVVSAGQHPSYGGTWTT